MTPDGEGRNEATGTHRWHQEESARRGKTSWVATLSYLVLLRQKMTVPLQGFLRPPVLLNVPAYKVVTKFTKKIRTFITKMG